MIYLSGLVILTIIEAYLIYAITTSNYTEFKKDKFIPWIFIVAVAIFYCAFNLITL